VAVPGPFDDDRFHGARAVLVRVRPDEQGRFQFELWTQYTRAGLNQMQVGDLVAVENYSPPSGAVRTYSILTLSEVLPTHFAAQGTDAYPGHVFESMQSIREDFELQDNRAVHATTVIVARAVSTGLQFSFDPTGGLLPPITEERNVPMTGAEVRPLNRQMVDSIVNRGIPPGELSPLSLKRFPEISVRLDVQALLTTHFGIFGFTGAGKSNFVSSLTASLTGPSGPGANVVLFDPSDEYLALLIDRFVVNPELMLYVNVGTDSLPGPVVNALGLPGEPPAGIVDMLRGQLKLPPTLMARPGAEERVRTGLGRVVPRTRIAVPESSVADTVRDALFETIPPLAGPEAREGLSQAVRTWTDHREGLPITVDSIRAAADFARPPASPVRAQITALVPEGTKRMTAMSALDRAVRALDRLANSMAVVPPAGMLSIQDLITQLNDDQTGRVVIITGRRDSDLKLFGKVLGEELYESRRIVGRRTPYTVFIFDEADLFLPNDENDDITAAIRETCVTIARRGRKFGLGIGLATQRVTHLDTHVMGNLHTYFVSKLPRASDRGRVAEAFGIGEEQLAPTFSFRPGNWLVLSHDATGLKGVPIPVTARDAVERIVPGPAQP
jgi:uncharacterized protein